MPFVIEYSPETEGHLRALTARQRATVFDSVDRQLGDQPLRETRNRKPMRPNPVAPWELRIGDLRVYYDVEESPILKVFIRAIGIKKRNRILIAGEEIHL